MSGRTNLARRIHGIALLRGQFLLRSGVTSDRYFDKYRFEAEPELLADIASAMAPSVPEGTEILAGLEMGGIPLVTMLSQATKLPARFVRKKAKEYGTCNVVEGGDFAGRRVLVVEDVVTSGGAILEAVAEMRRLGAVVDTVVCVIDRESSGVQNLAEVGLELRPLFRMSELEAAAESRGAGS